MPPAAEAVAGANPFVGLTPRQVGAAGGRWALNLARKPTVLAATALEMAGTQVRIGMGRGPKGIDAKDARFADPAWQHPLWHRVAQSYLAAAAGLLSTVDEVDLDAKSADRARFALMQLTEAAAPTNYLATNPVAMKRAVATRGRSLINGARHRVHDVRRNGGMPSQVDTRPFRVGETIAVTPGAVVHRTEMYELIQYEPTTPSVRQRPTVVVPPQVNRFYFLDLAPGRSFVEHAVASGLQVFLISWRNPGPLQRHWGLDAYAASVIEAMEIAADIAGSDDVNTLSLCAGGMTTSAVLAHLAHTMRPLVNAAGLAVTTIDTGVKSALNAFVSERSVKASLGRSNRAGVLPGRDLARVFAWVRPNDLIWRYWVNNYLMGENPPAFDVLAWNADSTNMPAALHAEFLRLFVDNALVTPGALTVLDSPVDLRLVRNDLYVVGALTDHLVPWQSAYAATQHFGGEVRFVLSNSGHIQALINPPGNPKASFWVGQDRPREPEQWLKGATRTIGSWWTDWAAWSIDRSGSERPRPRRLGSRRHPVLDAAPGHYVKESPRL